MGDDTELAVLLIAGQMVVCCAAFIAFNWKDHYAHVFKRHWDPVSRCFKAAARWGTRLRPRPEA